MNRSIAVHRERNATVPILESVFRKLTVSLVIEKIEVF